jgi:2-oxo-4-hydroxy-4-carboxy-5-ureidoimidazoline decarboxylase
MAKLSMDEVNELDKNGFVNLFGSLYENSPWIIEESYRKKPFLSMTTLHNSFVETVTQSDQDQQIALIRAHPDLAGKAAIAGDITKESHQEQTSAGLSLLTPEELSIFIKNNNSYREKFNFPFIIAVKFLNKNHILAAYESRIHNHPSIEKNKALEEIHKIAFIRLLDIVEPRSTGKLTTHVLDTAIGKPAKGMVLTLERLEGEKAKLIKTVTTNHDGRIEAPLLQGSELLVGRWSLTFFCGPYFLLTGQSVTAPSFLDKVPLHFSIFNPEQNYHVPLLVSPWSYSTYRGS